MDANPINPPMLPPNSPPVINIDEPPQTHSHSQPQPLPQQPSTPRTPIQPATPIISTPQPPEPSPIPDPNNTLASQAAVTDRIVLDYLRKRGYHKAEQALLQHDLGSAGMNRAMIERVDLSIADAVVDDDLRNVIMVDKPAELAHNDARRYEESYGEFRNWVDGSLDIYKAELHGVLYPLLVHSFLEIVRRERWKEARTFLDKYGAEFSEESTETGFRGRKEEIASLRGIASVQHLEENETARLFLQNRYELHLSTYAFELIVMFLTEDPRRHVLLQILNRRCAIRKANVEGTGGVSQAEINREREGFVGVTEKKGLLKQDILWGRLRPEHYIIPDEVDANAKAKASKAKPGEKAKLGEKAKDGGKKEGENEEEPTTSSDGTITESKIPLKRYRVGSSVLETTAERKSRAKVLMEDGEKVRSKVSILCYTFTNTKGDGLNCSAVSEDGSMVVAGFGDSTVRVWDAKASGTAGSGEGGFGGRAGRLVGHGGPVYSVEWSKCGKFVLSGGEDGTARLWHVGLKTDVVAYRGHNYPIWSVGWGPLGHYFATGSHDRTARVWCTDRIYPVRVLAGHLADVDVIRWHPNSNYLATGSSDRTARMWDVREGKCVRVFGGQMGTVHALAFSADGKTLACGGDGGCIEIWDIVMGSRVKRLVGHESTIWALEYSREGSVLASGGGDCTVCVWDAKEWCESIVEEENSLLMNGMVAHEGENGEANGIVDEEKGKDKAKDKEREVEEEKDKDRERTKETEAAGLKRKQSQADGSLIGKYETKETPIHTLKFTRRNVLIAAGSYGL